MRLFNEIAKRSIAFLLLAVMTFGAITYSLGYYEISFIDRGNRPYDDDTSQSILGTLAPGTNISTFTGEATTVIPSPDSSSVLTDAMTDPPQTTGKETTQGTATTEPVTPPKPPVTQFDTLASYISNGYKVTWADYDPSMKIAELVLDVSGLDLFSQGNSQREYVRMKMNYGEAHREIVYYSTVRSERPSLDVYMGYIIVDSGKGNVSSGISDRSYTDAERVGIYSSEGKLIGIYPSDEVIPANCRDSRDRALFVYNNEYYYLNSSTGRFELSDFIPEIDGRGLEFDYNPDFGKTDSKYNIYHTEQTITETFDIKSTLSYYTRYGVDSRLAEQIYLYYPQFAEQIAATFNKNGVRYYNRLFRGALDDVIIGVQSGLITRPPETTTSEPETTIAPEVTTEPDVTTSPDVTTEPDVTISPEVTTTPEATTEPEVATSPEVTEEEETTAASEATDPPETSHVFTEETTATLRRARSVIATKDDIGSSVNPNSPDGVPDGMMIDISYTAYRFTYRASQPKADTSKTTTVKYTHNSEFIGHTISWSTDFKYAKAFNFKENRAYTVDDTGIVKIINTSGNNAVYLYKTRIADSSQGSFWRLQYYTEPFERDEYMLGHYYFEDGLIRMRVVERLTYKLNEYEDDYEVIVDTKGNQVNAVPEGYNVISYSDSVFLVERNGRYGYYHRDGRWVAQPIYTYAAPFIEGLAVLGYESGIKGVIDTEGNIVIPFAYNEISNASTGIFAVYSEADGWKVLAKVKK